MRKQTLALLPLDDRPPCLLFPQRIAAIAGVALSVPPRELLGNFLQPGSTSGLSEWLVQQAECVDAALVAVDMLTYGGLVASRTLTVSEGQALYQLETLRAMKQANPALHLLAANVIMRISITASDAEMAAHYRNLIRYSELSWLVENEGREDLREEYQRILAALPAAVLKQYLGARQRNHHVNQRMLDYLDGDVVEKLLLLQEDASVAGPHLKEQRELRTRAQSLGLADRVQVYPGADEGTQTLLASWLNRSIPPRVQVAYSSIEGANQAAPFEDRPLRMTVARHLAAAGVQVVNNNSAEAVLWVHCTCSDEEAAAAADRIEALLQADQVVAIADVRYPNGSDPQLMALLCQRGLLPRLGAYAGWNTAGNTIGTTVAHLCAFLVMKRQPDATAQQRSAHQNFLWERCVDDWGYQRVIREQVESVFTAQGWDPLNLGEHRDAAEALVRQELSAWMARFADQSGWPGGAPETQIHLPWPRTFEVEVSAAV